jgi:uncharacterized membrane protein HdeD (DUF308 family)
VSPVYFVARPLKCFVQIVRVILAKNWWSLLIRGAAAMALGAVAVGWRDISLGDLILMFFGFALIDGVVGLAGAVRAAETHGRWLPLLLEAAIGIAAALLAVAWPGIMTIGVLIYIIGAWALLTGILEIASGVLLRRHIRGEWLLGLSGSASLLLGVLMASLPLASPGGIALWLGTYAFAFGALLIVLSLRLRSWASLPLAES